MASSARSSLLLAGTVAVALLPYLTMAYSNSSLSTADMLRAQLALMNDRPDGCPPCFNCLLPAHTCAQYADCNEYNGKCHCPDGFGGDDCLEPLCGSLGRGKDRPMRSGSSCECDPGWAGINCNVCTENKACNALMETGAGGVCYQNGEVVNYNHQICDVTNKQITGLLGEQRPEVTFTCKKEEATCDFQFWVDAVESFYCHLTDCDSGADFGETKNTTSYKCEHISCSCIPGRMLCGKDGSIDLSDFLDQAIQGPGGFACTQRGGGSHDCAFTEPEMDKLIHDLIGDSSILLDCRAGECLYETEVPGYRRPVKQINTPLIAGVIAGCALFVVAVIVLTWFLSRRKLKYGAIRLEDSDDESTKLMADHKPAALYFSNVSYSLNGKSILSGIRGICHPGEVTAIMGASGAGKTSLLDILARKNKRGLVSGDFYVNGEKVGTSEYKKVVGFVDQEDTMLPTLTVHETILNSALLRLPRDMGRAAKEQRVLEVERELGIHHIRDSLIGSEEGKGRGISGGEKRRVGIACELVTSPSILFLDEPTSGLDAYNAYNVVECLVTLAKTYKRTVIFTIHQPRSNIVALFDRLLLLAQGKTVYSGPFSHCQAFFDSIGYECPPGFNIADYLVDLTMHAGSSTSVDDGTVAADVSSLGPSSTRAVKSIASISGEDSNAEPSQSPRPRNLRRDSVRARQERELFTRRRHAVDTAASSDAGGEDALAYRLQTNPPNTTQSGLEEDPHDLPPSAMTGTDLDLMTQAFSHSNITSAMLAEIHQAISAAGEANGANSNGYDTDSPIALNKTAMGRGYARVGYLRQFLILSQRTWKNLYRNPMLMLTHYAIAIILAVFSGYLFYGLTDDIPGFQNRLGLFFFLLALFGFSTLTSLNVFATERLLFVRERANGYYSPATYFAAKVLFDIIPLRIVPPILMGSIVYPMTGLVPDSAHFFKFILVLVLFNLAAAAICLFIGIVCKDGSVANLIGSLVMLFSLLFAGFLLNHDATPAGALWLQTLSIFHYGFAQTKYLGLQVLDNVISTRWKVLPRDQCQGIRNFIVQFIIQSSSSEEALQSNKTLLNKLNLVLISVLKQEWPHNWPTFINEIISSCHANLSICENNMIILRLLSEEVFDYSAEQMTSTKTRNMKQTMCAEFSQIFQLCQEVLTTADQPSLVKATLETLLRFCNWIPLGYIFETNLIDTLRTRFLSVPEFRNITLQCLTEIGGLQTGGAGQANSYDEQLVKMFTEVLTTIADIIPVSLDLKSTYPSSNSRDQEFVQNLALFLCNFFGAHLNLIENLPNRDYLLHGHYYLIRISQIDDREIFKICLDYWLKLVQELYEEMQQLPITDLNPLMAVGGGMSGSGAPNPSLLMNYPLRKHKYNEVLSNLRVVMIERMVRPEEVLIVENDEGEIVREFVKESDTVQLYKTIRECLVYLTHLDVVDTENIMTEKLARQVDGSEWSWHNCNVLCWAIGSISLAMNEETEKRFLVTVIKDLLGLTEMKRGKDNKAVVASNIMYIVGQYPRFLKAHWKFLKTVVNKLFEFMHESHEGVQDMACDTFIKIARQCRRHFVALQPSEQEPFIEEIVRNMGKITCDLTPQQVHTFYEACGYMVAAQGNKHQQERLLADLMNIPNAAWDEIIKQATVNPSILQDAETIKVIGNIMKTNVSACTSIGPYFYPQIGRIYHDMLQMYRATSTLISEAVARDGELATKMPKVRGLRTIKKEILKLIETYVEKAEDLQAVRLQMVPPLLDSVLVDYNRNVPGARDAEVLKAMSTIITKLSVKFYRWQEEPISSANCHQSLMEDQVPTIMENVFECTLDMINKDFSEFPEHRVEFFNLLRAINLHCFPALLKLDNNQFKFVIDSCSWAFKHDNRDVEAAGLNMCLELINNIADKTDVATANAFFQRFFTTILQDVLFVVTDSDHKAGFKTQSMLLMKLFYFIQPADGSQPKIQGPIYTPDQAQAGTTNKDFLGNSVATLLRNAFPNLQAAQVASFVEGLFNLNTQYDKFRLNLRDFLISLKEFAGDNAELYIVEKEQQERDAKAADMERRQKVGGLLKPSEIDDEEL